MVKYKKTKSIQVIMTEDEWRLIKQLVANPSEYLRQIYLNRLNKPITVRIILTGKTFLPEHELDILFHNFEDLVEKNFPEFINSNTKFEYNNGKFKIIWMAKTNKANLPVILQMHGEPILLCHNLPIQNQKLEIKYNKESI